MDKVDEEYLKEILEHGSGASDPDKIKAHDVSVKDEGLSMDELQVSYLCRGGLGTWRMASVALLKSLRILLRYFSYLYLVFL